MWVGLTPSVEGPRRRERLPAQKEEGVCSQAAVWLQLRRSLGPVARGLTCRSPDLPAVAVTWARHLKSVSLCTACWFCFSADPN